ncbi:hypothetical protein BOX15_Mlig006179g4, partial [Macrostomum lignano]
YNGVPGCSILGRGLGLSALFLSSSGRRRCSRRSRSRCWSAVALRGGFPAAPVRAATATAALGFRRQPVSSGSSCSAGYHHAAATAMLPPLGPFGYGVLRHPHLPPPPPPPPTSHSKIPATSAHASNLAQSGNSSGKQQRQLDQNSSALSFVSRNNQNINNNNKKLQQSIADAGANLDSRLLPHQQQQQQQPQIEKLKKLTQLRSWTSPLVRWRLLRAALGLLLQALECLLPPSRIRLCFIGSCRRRFLLIEAGPAAVSRGDAVPTEAPGQTWREDPSS